MKRTLLIGILSLSALMPGRGSAAEVSGPDAVNAIVGEAAGCPYLVKLGIAEAIRNRSRVMKHPLHGVYGFNAKHNANEPAAVWADATRAWESALRAPHSALVGGATNFGSAADVAKGTFQKLHLTTILGSGRTATYFFKP